MGSSNVRMSPITGENLGLKQDLEQGSRYSMGDPNGVYPSMGDPRGISPILEQNLRSKSKLDLGYLPALTAEVIVGGSSMVQRASTTYSAGSDVGTVIMTATDSIGTADIAAAKDISILCLQLVTRAQAKMAAKELVPGEELLEPLLDLIAKHQEQDLYYKQIARQAFYPCWQLDLALAKIGPRDNDYTIYHILGGIRNLLCVVHYVIVPVQTSLCIELLCQFYDCLMAGHWGVYRTLNLL
jgi:hypothetical protein